MASKITKWQSERIGDQIAKKAFEHLFVPVHKRQAALAQQAYNSFMAGFSDQQIRLLVEADMLQLGDNILITVKNHAGQEELLTDRLNTLEDGFYVRRGWGNIEFLDDELYSAASDAKTEENKLGALCSNLRCTITSQCAGKSPNSVLKAWPEAGDILMDVVGSIDGGSLTTPLEQLLARFLPMLPAPQSEGV